MSKILLVAGHGQGDPGAGGGGFDEATTMRQLVNKIKTLIPNDVDVYNTALDCYKQNGLATTSYTNVIEFHMDGAANTAACGGHVIISSGFSPDALDTALKNVIAKHIGLKSSLPSGFSYRNDLQNLNVAAKRGITYRLLELGFITNSSDRNKTIGNMDALAKLLAEAISGKTTTPPKADLDYSPDRMHGIRTFWYVWDSPYLADLRKFLKANNFSYTEFKSSPWIGLEIKWFNQNSPNKRKVMDYLEARGFNYEIIMQPKK